MGTQETLTKKFEIDGQTVEGTGRTIKEAYANAHSILRRRERELRERVESVAQSAVAKLERTRTVYKVAQPEIDGSNVVIAVHGHPVEIDKAMSEFVVYDGAPIELKDMGMPRAGVFTVTFVAQ